MLMSVLARLRRKVTDLLISEVPGPYEPGAPPDPDGRRGSDQVDHDRASLDAQVQARGSAGMGGTVVSSPIVVGPEDDRGRPA
jgi:hypothetical protein